MINRKILQFAIRDFITEVVLVEAIAKEFNIPTQQVVAVRADKVQDEIITYFLEYYTNGWAVSLSLYINELRVTTSQKDWEIVESLARRINRDIITSVPTEIPTLQYSNECLLLTKPNGDRYLVVEADSEDGMMIDETSSMMQKIQI